MITCCLEGFFLKPSSVEEKKSKPDSQLFLEARKENNSDTNTKPCNQKTSYLQVIERAPYIQEQTFNHFNTKKEDKEKKPAAPSKNNVSGNEQNKEFSLSLYDEIKLKQNDNGAYFHVIAAYPNKNSDIPINEETPGNILAEIFKKEPDIFLEIENQKLKNIMFTKLINHNPLLIKRINADCICDIATTEDPDIIKKCYKKILSSENSDDIKNFKEYLCHKLWKPQAQPLHNFYPEELKNDKEFLAKAIRIDPSAYEFADDSMQKNEQFFLESVKLNGYTILFLNRELMEKMDTKRFMDTFKSLDANEKEEIEQIFYDSYDYYNTRGKDALTDDDLAVLRFLTQNIIGNDGFLPYIQEVVEELSLSKNCRAVNT